MHWLMLQTNKTKNQINNIKNHQFKLKVQIISIK